MVSTYEEISKDVSALKATPNLLDWAGQRQSWDWDAMWDELDTPDGLVNLAHECIDRHANGERADKLAMIWQSAGGDVENYTYSDMKAQTNKVANAFRAAGVEKGDRVFFLSDRNPGAVLRGLRLPQAGRDRGAAVLRIRPGADQRPRRARRGQSHRHHAEAAREGRRDS